MKPSMSLMKMTIKLLILMILFVIIFLISSLLYSARYWPDIYNYINANITIKRIPTLSELNLTIIEVEYVTEAYTTTDVEYIDVSTIDAFDLEEFTLDEVEIKSETKRSILIEKPKDYIELPSRGIFIDYVFLEEPITTDKDETDKIRDVDHTVTLKAIGDSEINKILIRTEFTTTSNGIATEDNANDSTKDLRPETDENSRNLAYKMPDMNNEKDINNIRIETDFDSYEEAKRLLHQELLEHETVVEDNDQIDEVIKTNEGYLVGDGEEEITNRLYVTTVTNGDNEIGFTRIMQDLVDESHLTTRDAKDVEMFTGRPRKMKMIQKVPESTCHGNATCDDFTMTVYPWLVAIFVKNGSNNQFNYYCDGALVSDRFILTNARCVRASNKSLDPEHILVFLGKGSLQIMNGNEKIQKIKEIIVHDNFTASGEPVNDLAFLVMEEPVVFTNAIQAACLQEDSEEVGEAATTAWGLNGELMPIFFNKQKSDNCFDKDNDIFCATYGNHVALCPSYGGVYAARSSNKWCLQGVFYGDPAERGICITKNVLYTSLNNYIQWIDNIISVNKNDL